MIRAQNKRGDYYYVRVYCPELVHFVKVDSPLYGNGVKAIYVCGSDLNKNKETARAKATYKSVAYSKEGIQCVDLRIRTAFVIVKSGSVEHHVFVLIRVPAHSDRQNSSRLEAYIKHGRGFYRFQ